MTDSAAEVECVAGAPVDEDANENTEDGGPTNDDGAEKLSDECE